MAFYRATLSRVGEKAYVEHYSSSASPKPWTSQNTKLMSDLTRIEHPEAFTYNIAKKGVKHAGDVIYDDALDATWKTHFDNRHSIIVKVAFGVGAGELILDLVP